MPYPFFSSRSDSWQVDKLYFMIGLLGMGDDKVKPKQYLYLTSMDSLKETKSNRFRIKTQTSTAHLLAQKNQYHRYDTSLFHKTRYHLMPLKQNPELYIKVDSISQQLGKIKRNKTTNSTAKLGSTLYSNKSQWQQKKNVYLPHSINIRNKLTKYHEKQFDINEILTKDNKVLVTAKKWVIFDMEGNKTLKGYKQKKQHDVASLSKIMTFYTAYMIIQQYYLAIDTLELISDKFDSAIMGTTIKIKPETIVSLEDMLYAMMLGSANNAATIIATNLGSLVKKKKEGKYFSCYDILTQSKQKNMNTFIQLMNGYAKQLQMTTTTFVNVHGIANNISSAVDIAKLTSQCYKIPLFSKIVITKNYFIKLKYIDDFGQLREEEQNITNTNKLLWLKNGCIGGKTGCNVKGGESLVSCYEGNIIIVVLGCGNRQQKFSDSQKLMQWLNKKLQ